MDKKPLFIAGPCVIESAELLDTVAVTLADINRRLGVEIIFKASFDKANRKSISSFRGPGLEKGLRMLADVRSKWGLRLLTDIHESCQAAPVGEVVDVIQIPAFLCRQTDLLVAAARTGRTVNIKKAQFLSGEDMRYPYEKAMKAGAGEVWLTERGNMYGNNNKVFDIVESEGYIRLKADACTSSKELYEVYRMWCEENSLNAIKARGFSDALIANQRRYNLESTNNIVNSSGRRVRGFVGIEALVQPDLTPNGWRA